VSHEDDFRLHAYWNLFSTSHDMDACDSVGGTIKSYAFFYLYSNTCAATIYL